MGEKEGIGRLSGYDPVLLDFILESIKSANDRFFCALGNEKGTFLEDRRGKITDWELIEQASKKFENYNQRDIQEVLDGLNKYGYIGSFMAEMDGRRDWFLVYFDTAKAKTLKTSHFVRETKRTRKDTSRKNSQHVSTWIGVIVGILGIVVPFFTSNSMSKCEIDAKSKKESLHNNLNQSIHSEIDSASKASPIISRE